MMSYQKHVVVIGSGLAGLSASYSLVKAGVRVTMLEASHDIGGLASSFRIGKHSVERFYHFICKGDRHLITLVNELGIGDKIHWKPTRTSFFHNGHLYSFGTPIDLIRFSAIPPLQRLRFGFHILRSNYRSHWHWLDQIPAKPWLIENIGERAYEVIWHPLLKIKFGQYYDRISAAWVWHRIWRVAQSRHRLWERETFGYLEEGSATLVEKLVDWLHANPIFHIATGTPVKQIETQNSAVTSVKTYKSQFLCDAVISTVALPVLERFITERFVDYISSNRLIEYIGVLCVIFNLRQPFSRNFWMNINDARISFNGIIEQTNLNENMKKAGLNLIYIPYYLPTSEARYNYSDEEIFNEYTGMLKLINPEFDLTWIKDRFIFRAPYAQAICITGFSNLIPKIRSPIPGLYVTDSSQFYPEDRTLSAAIQQGCKAARLVIEDLS